MSTIRKIAAMYNCKNPDAIKALKSHDFNIRRWVKIAQAIRSSYKNFKVTFAIEIWLPMPIS